jgi:molecular chaperone Hsp33
MVARAGGVIAQGMPGADLDRLGSLRQGLVDGAFAALSDAAPDDPARWLSTLAGDTRIVDTAPVEWRCRCSHDRVVAALRMLGVEDLADMVHRGGPAEVRCDFCAKTYEVAPDEVARVYAGMIEAKG